MKEIFPLTTTADERVAIIASVNDKKARISYQQEHELSVSVEDIDDSVMVGLDKMIEFIVEFMGHC